MKWILAGVCALTLFTTATVAQTHIEHPILAMGANAPGFNLPGVDGKTYSLASFRQSPILVLVFTCNHCPTAQAYEDRVKKLATDYSSRGVAVVGIMPNDPKAVQLRFPQKRKLLISPTCTTEQPNPPPGLTDQWPLRMFSYSTKTASFATREG